MLERWVTIPDWDMYEISNLGRLRAKERVVRKGHNPYIRKAQLLKPVKDKHGYWTFNFKQDNRKKNVKLHRLVAICFIPNPNNKPYVNHIDNNPANNRVDNLEWVTAKENTRWSIVQGRMNRTDKWLENLHKAQEPTYKPVKAINIKTGETLYFENLNQVREQGFQPSCVCNCCKHIRNTHKGYMWEYAT